MNKKLVPAIVISLAIMAGTAMPALAREAELSAAASVSVKGGGIRQVIKDLRDKFRGEVKDKKEDLKKDIEAKRDEVKKNRAERLSDARKQKIRAWWKRVQRRLSSLIDREYKVAQRIQERIDKLKEKGRDVAKVQADLNTAKVKVDLAKSGLASASAQVELIIANNPPKDAFAKLHDLQKNVLGKIREAHSALVKVLASTRGLSVTPTPTPSPSASPSPSTTP